MHGLYARYILYWPETDKINSVHLPENGCRAVTGRPPHNETSHLLLGQHGQQQGTAITTDVKDDLIKG